MSRRRTTSDSRKGKTDPKKMRSIDPEEQKSHDLLAALFKKFPPPPLPQPPDPVAELIDYDTTRCLVEKLVISDELVLKAKEFLVLAGRDDIGVDLFSNVVREIWPRLTSAITKAMDSLVDAPGLVLRNANRDSATQRWDRMRGEPWFEPCLRILGSLTKFDVMRLFLSILICYWGDKAELPKLDDDATGKPYFGRRISADEMAKKLRCLLTPKRVEKFSYEIKDADHAKNMESVREWLETQYGDEKNVVDVDALLEQIKSKLLSHVKISQACGIYNGKMATVDIRVADAWHANVSMRCTGLPGF